MTTTNKVVPEALTINDVPPHTKFVLIAPQVAFEIDITIDTQSGLITSPQPMAVIWTLNETCHLIGRNNVEETVVGPIVGKIRLLASAVLHQFYFQEMPVEETVITA